MQSQSDLLPMTQNEIFLKYFDISEVIMEYYTKKKTSHIDKYFMEVEHFLNQPLQSPSENKPLVILTEKGFGRKTFLVKWIEYHKENHKQNYPIQDIILPFFSTVSEKNSNYFYAIYRFLVQLREKLNVKQKVELLEDKLRKYFGYWLDVCSRKIHKQVIKQKISSDSKIILVIDRVDKFIDPSMSKEANIAFWLPRVLPDKVRVIITCDKSSESYAYFLKNQAKILEIHSDIEITNFMIKRNEEKEGFAELEVRKKILNCLMQYNEALKKNCKFVEIFLACFLPAPNDLIPKLANRELIELDQILKTLDLGRLSKINGLGELIDFILMVYEGKIMSIDKFQKLLIILSISHKGLTKQELLLLVHIKKEELDFFIAIFKGYVIEFKSLFCIFNSDFKAKVFERYQKDQDFINQLHEEISEVLEKSSISIRKLEEQTFHLYISKSYFKLKETVSIIENFLLLFNPNNKFDLCHYWQTLLDNGFDPALEYNKSIEGFEMHYKPTFEDIFRIILQVSRFLKEFSDFETESTPLFRHPPIMGSKELEDIGLMVEIKAVNMFTYPDLRKTHAILSNIEGVNIAKEASRDDFRMYFIEKMKQKKASEQMFGSKDVEDNQIQTFDKISNINNFKTLNVITNAMILDDKKNPDSDTSDSEHSKYDNNDMVEYRRKREFFLKEGYESKELNSTMNVNNKNNVSLIENNSIDNNNNKGLIPCFYYYKRWLWMIFPWACLSQNRKCNFSEQIIKSYSSATRYISVLEENKYTKRALKIALEAKLKKKMIYGRKEEIEEEMNTLRNMTKEMILLEQMNRHGKFENSIDYEPLKRKPKKNIVKLDPLNDMSTISKDLNKGKSISSNIQKANTNFFLTQGQADPFQKPAMSTLSKLGRSKMSFMKEKYSTYNEGNHLLSGLSIEEKSLRILPKLKDSISNHNKGALNVLAEEIKQLKNDYNGLLFSNKMLEKKLKEMKYVESNNNLFGTEKEDFNVELLKSKVQNLDEKFRSNMDYFEETQKQKERINTILTICKRNKMQNEEYIRSLNYLLTNFKKCIRKEHDSITKNKMKTKSIQQIVESLVGLIGDNLVNHSKLVSQIKNDLTCKLKFDMSFADVDKKILSSSMQKSIQKKGNKNIQEQNEEPKKIPTNDKASKHLSEKLELMKEQHERLSSILASDLQPDVLQSERFENFKTLLENRSEILQQNIEKQDKIDILQNVLASKKMLLASLQRNNNQTSDENELDKNNLIKAASSLDKEHESKCRDFIILKKSLLNSLMILNTLQDKIQETSPSIEKLKNFDSESFVKTLQEHMLVIKGKISQEEYSNFEQMKVSEQLLYKGCDLKVEVASGFSLDLTDD